MNNLNNELPDDHPNKAKIFNLSSLIEITSCQLDIPDEYGEDMHPFYFDNHIYNMLWTSTGDRKLLALNLKTGRQDGFDFHVKQRSVKSIIRKFRPLPTTFINLKPGLVLIEYFYDDAYRSCSLNRCTLDFEKRECRITDEIHDFSRTNFCQIDFVRNDPKLLMHFESNINPKRYTIYEIINGSSSSSIPTLKVWLHFDYNNVPLASPCIQDDYLFASKPPNSVYVRHLTEEKSAIMANPKPSFYTDFIGAVPSDNGLKLYFLIRGQQPRFSDVGVIQWNNEFKIVPHKNLFTIPTGWWRCYGIFNDAILVCKLVDDEHTYYWLPMSDPQLSLR